jgi:hypothetical protein
MDGKVHGHQQTQYPGLYKDIRSLFTKLEDRLKMFECIIIDS